MVPEPVEGEQTQGSVAVLVKQPLPLWEQQQQGRLGLREAQEVEAGLEAEASQAEREHKRWHRVCSGSRL